MNNRSENSIEIIIEHTISRNFQEEIQSWMNELLWLFNDRILEIIHWIEAPPKNQSTFLRLLWNSFHKITNIRKPRKEESISEVVERNCLKLMTICEKQGIAIFPVFWNLILEWINIPWWIKIGTISLRKNDWITVDTIDSIYAKAEKYLSEETHQKV